jgi:hypothetical protein
LAIGSNNCLTHIPKLSDDVYSYILFFLPPGYVFQSTRVNKKTYECCQPIFQNYLSAGEKIFKKFLPIEKSFSDGHLENSKKNFIKFLDFVNEEEPEFGTILKKNKLQFDLVEKEIYDENLITFCKKDNASSISRIQNSFSEAKGSKENFFQNLFPGNPDSIGREFALVLYEELSKTPLSEINNVNTLRLIKKTTLSFINEKIAAIKEKNKNEPLSEDENNFLTNTEKLTNKDISSHSHVSTLRLLLGHPPISKDEPIFTLFPEEIFEKNAIIPIKSLDFRGHHIHLIPGQLEGLQQLESMNGSWNPIKKLPECIALPNLKTIIFNGTLLEEIPSCLEKSQKLEELNFAFCQIDHFPGKWILNLPNLKYLCLRGNKIQDIPWEVYLELKNKRVEVDLSENPLKINKRTLKIHAFEYLQNVKKHPVWHVGTTATAALFCEVFFSCGYPICIAAAASSSLLVWKGFEFLNQRGAKLFHDYFLKYKKK